MRRLTINEFIEKSQKIHKNIYSYDESVYINNDTPIKIICKKHGEFFQIPWVHLSNHGCPKCGDIFKRNKNRKSKKNFIKDIIKIHKNKYDYSLVNYINNKTKIKIICKKHGIFEQIPSNHLKGSVCPKCKLENDSKNKRKSAYQFILDAIKIFGNRYDYSLVNYINSKTKIKIICKKHGIFFQIPAVHLRGGNCPKCKISKKLNKEKFINKSNKIHSNYYDYSKFIYINTRTKGIIICPNHGEFSQKAGGHLMGRGCSKCSFIISRPEIEFLNHLNIPNNKENRQVYLGRSRKPISL